MRIRNTLLTLSIAVLVAACGSSADPADPTTPATSAPAEAGTSAAPEDRTHVLSDPVDGGVGITVTIPASGWSGEPGGWAMETGPDGFDAPGGAGLIAFTVDEEFYVYGDPCAWSTTRPDTPATTVDELVAALADQRSRNASAPEEITVGGYQGMKLTLHVPDDAAFGDCDEGAFATLGVAGEDPALWAQGPGEIDETWIVDVDGRIALLSGGYYEGTPQSSVEELHAILASMRLEP
jgi:hypothetical protein